MPGCNICKNDQFPVYICPLFKATIKAATDEDFRALFLITLVLLVSGSIFYMNFENWSFLDALYFCTMTMTTVGYGDLVPTSPTSKFFTIIYTFSSIGTFVALAAKLATAMTDSLRNEKNH